MKESACSLLPCKQSSVAKLHGQRRACWAAAAHDQSIAGAPEPATLSSSSSSWGQRVLGSLRPPEVLQPGLYVVGTPIGNLEDITLRALRVLRDVDLLLAEDTRHTRKLLTHFGIGAGRPLLSFHAHNEHERQAQACCLCRCVDLNAYMQPAFLRRLARCVLLWLQLRCWRCSREARLWPWSAMPACQR